MEEVLRTSRRRRSSRKSDLRRSSRRGRSSRRERLPGRPRVGLRSSAVDPRRGRAGGDAAEAHKGTKRTGRSVAGTQQLLGAQARTSGPRRDGDSKLTLVPPGSPSSTSLLRAQKCSWVTRLKVKQGRRAHLPSPPGLRASLALTMPRGC